MQQLYEGHREKIFRLAWRTTRDRSDAQDILQDTFIKAFSALGRSGIREVRHFSTWLYRIGVNCSLDLLRRRHTSRSIGDHADNGPIDPALGPDLQAERREYESRVTQGLKRLSDRQRLILTLRHYEGLKVCEIAGHLGCSEGSVKKQLFRGIAILRRHLQAEHEEA